MIRGPEDSQLSRSEQFDVAATLREVPPAGSRFG